MKVYVALRSVPDYHAPPPTYHSVHHTLDGAINALYPDNENFQQSFKKWANSITGEDVWEGPDGFGMIRLVEVQE